MDLRTAALLLAIALIAIGLYRLYEELHRPAPAPPPRAPDKPRERATRARGEGAPRATPAGAKPAGTPAVAVGAPADAAPPAPADAAPPAPPAGGAPSVPSVARLSDDGEADDDITLVVSASKEVLLAREAARSATPEAAAGEAPALPVVPFAADAPADDEQEGEPSEAVPLVFDDGVGLDPPGSAPVVVSAAGRTDQGRRRRRNEDSLLVRSEQHLFVIADGMGGHAGGDVASKLAVELIGAAVGDGEAATPPAADLAALPRPGGELASAIHGANAAIYGQAKKHMAYRGMGTTVVCARFAPLESRLYVGHVGDSRCYRLRGGAFTQMTTDHTLGAQGVMGPLASQLERAVGVKPSVRVDLIVASPRAGDVYLLCSDGLSKMVPDPDIQAILLARRDLDEVVRELVGQANARGGRDNITVIVVEVKAPGEVVDGPAPAAVAGSPESL